MTYELQAISKRSTWPWPGPPVFDDGMIGGSFTKSYLRARGGGAPVGFYLCDSTRWATSERARGAPTTTTTTQPPVRATRTTVCGRSARGSDAHVHVHRRGAVREEAGDEPRDRAALRRVGVVDGEGVEAAAVPLALAKRGSHRLQREERRVGYS
jgi:hypothetical protein